MAAPARLTFTIPGRNCGPFLPSPVPAMPRFPITVDGLTLHNYAEAIEAIDEVQSELDGGEISNYQRMIFRDFIDNLRYILATE